ncbi:MAG: DUF6132 family protein [Opitutaceae bacterium]
MNTVPPILIGAVIGGLIGYFGRCRTGACLLTSRWWAGALYGALLGYLLAAR